MCRDLLSKPSSVWIGSALVALSFLACGCGAGGTRDATKPATLALRSAIVVAPTTAPTSVTMTSSLTTTFSCRGEAFCREDVILSSNEDLADVTADVRSDCARHHGTLSESACPRDAVIASCSVAGGEAGPITVFSYSQSSTDEQAKALATMTELCEHFEGSLTLTSRN